MQAVWKFQIPLMHTEPEIEMPEFANILHFDMDPDPGNPGFAVWAEVDTTEEGRETRSFIIRGTGHGISWNGERLREDQYQFLGTVINGNFVFHCWEYDREGFTQPWEKTDL